MKPLVLVLACLILPAQTLYYMDCCCGDFCTHKNACTGCEEDQSKPCEVHPNHQAGGDCCPTPAPAPRQEHHHKKACAHVSPSSEVNVQAADLGIPTPVGAELLAVVPLVQEPELLGVRDYLVEQVPRPEGDLPLHLFLSVLQV